MGVHAGSPLRTCIFRQLRACSDRRHLFGKLYYIHDYKTYHKPTENAGMKGMSLPVLFY